MVNSSLNLPPPRPQPKLNIQSWEPLENDDVVPFVFVADNAFPLTTGIMKPYPDKGLTDKKRFLDTVLSRYRRVTESTFGIMASAFRAFYSKINLNPDKATKVVLAAIVFHNILLTGHANTYAPPRFADEIDGDNVVGGSWRKEVNLSVFQPLPPQKFGNKSKRTAESIREYFADYFYGPGAVPWQWKTLI